MEKELEMYAEIPGAKEVEALFDEIRENIGEFLARTARPINNYKAKIPKALPRELKCILRRGIYRIAQASTLLQASESLKIMKERYYKAEAITRIKIQVYNNTKQQNS